MPGPPQDLKADAVKEHELQLSSGALTDWTRSASLMEGTTAHDDAMCISAILCGHSYTMLRKKSAILPP